MNLDVEDIKGNLGEGELLLEYYGELQNEIIPFLFEKLEKNLEGKEHVTNRAKRIGKLSLEILQNSLKYVQNSELNKPYRHVLFLLFKNGDQYVLISGNTLKKADMMDLHNKLSKVNQLKRAEADESYLSELNEGELSSKGAGLGLLEIIRKTGNKFKYEFIEQSPEYSFYILKVTFGEPSNHKKLEIHSAQDTPSVMLNKVTGELKIEGRSIPHNAVSFYRPILEWVEDYINDPASHTNVEINLDYINTSSSKCLLEMFKKLEGLPSGTTAEIVWYYEDGDDDMHEAGEDYELIVDIPFNFVVVPEN